MSVRLTAEKDRSCDTSNGEWSALCAMATAFGIENASWNGCHDGQIYSATTLREMADRADQIGKAADMLRWIADHGGAQLS